MPVNPLSVVEPIAKELGPDIIQALQSTVIALVARDYDKARRQLEEAIRVRAFDEAQKTLRG